MDQRAKQRIIVAVGVFAILTVTAVTVYRAEKSDVSKKDSTDQADVETAAEYSFLTGPQLKEKIRKEQVQLVDLRSPEEFGLEHIIDSVNVRLGDLETSPSLDSGKETVLIGAANVDEIDAAIANLKKRGVGSVHILQGGFVDWKSIGERTVTWGDLSSFQDQAKVSFMTLDEFRGVIAKKQPALVIDARRNVFYNEGHIEGSVNIPLAEIEKRRAEVGGSKQIIIYADNEIESFQAAVKLYDMKLLSVNVVRGGLDVWKEKGYETVK